MKMTSLECLHKDSGWARDESTVLGMKVFQ